MGKLSIKPIRLRNLGKNKTREQQSTKQNHPAKDASNANNDGYDVNNNKREINQHPVSEYGTRQAVSSSYIVRRRLANLLEERFPGRWSMIEIRADNWVIDMPAPLSQEDLESCENGGTVGPTAPESS